MWFQMSHYLTFLKHVFDLVYYCFHDSPEAMFWRRNVKSRLTKEEIFGRLFFDIKGAAIATAISWVSIIFYLRKLSKPILGFKV